jgi:hypothetical protein
LASFWVIYNPLRYATLRCALDRSQIPFRGATPLWLKMKKWGFSFSVFGRLGTILVITSNFVAISRDDSAQVFISSSWEYIFLLRPFVQVVAVGNFEKSQRRKLFFTSRSYRSFLGINILLRTFPHLGNKTSSRNSLSLSDMSLGDFPNSNYDISQTDDINRWVRKLI